MKKTDRIAEFMVGLGVKHDGGSHSYLAGYLECFNSGLYYEAHDVLEDLWLRQGRGHPDYAFHKGLIQLAGGFVHLRLQYHNPDHPKHGRRIAPACRLLMLASENLRPYPPCHLGIDVDRAIRLAEETMVVARGKDSLKNPWDPSRMPTLNHSFQSDRERR
jgi:uncharacterized protein